MNHLILMGEMKKEMLDKKTLPLTSDDYREGATIMEVLDDIYGFTENFPPDVSTVYNGGQMRPGVIWKVSEPREFKGISYDRRNFNRNQFGKYNECIKALDLTAAVKTPPYFQISFKSLRLYLECPVRFYYNIILGLKSNSERAHMLTEDEPDNETIGYKEDEEINISGHALLMGAVIHGYLEKHRFGDPLDKGHFENIWQRLSSHELDKKNIDTAVLQNLKEKALYHLRNTVNDNNLLNIMNKNINYAEIPFLINISSGIEFRGIIDRLYRNRVNDRWEIIDWKSNSIGEKDPASIAKNNYYYLQLACYKLAAESILKEEIGGLYVYFTENGRLLECQCEEDPEVIINEMRKMVERCNHDTGRWLAESRERIDPATCNFCDFRGVICRETDQCL